MLTSTNLLEEGMVSVVFQPSRSLVLTRASPRITMDPELQQVWLTQLLMLLHKRLVATWGVARRVATNRLDPRTTKTWLSSLMLTSTN